MLKRDDGGGLFALAFGLVAIIAVACLVAFVASVILTVGTAGGTLYGGGSAIWNYIRAFKKNVIDDNRSVANAL